MVYNNAKGPIPRVLLMAILPLMAERAGAVGLGHIKVYSHLGQPLRAEIPIQLDRDQPLVPEQFVARIADMEMHRQRGFSFPSGFEGIRLEVVSDQGGDLSLRLTSRQPMNEPIMNFLVRLQWPNGEFVREVTALLDPPNLASTRAFAKTTPKGAGETFAPPVAPPPQRFARGSESGYGPVRPGETLMEVARNFQQGASRPLHRVMRQIFERNPGAFVNHDINRLREGAFLTIPDFGAKRPKTTIASAPKAKPVEERFQPEKKPLPKADPELLASETRYGPITAGESLWRIAARVQGSSRPSDLYPWMRAVVERNPDAFVGQDMNRMKSGVVLVVPGGSGRLPKKEPEEVRGSTPVVPPAAAQPPVVPDIAAEPPIASLQPQETAPLSPHLEKTDIPGVTEEPVLRVTGLDTEQDNAVRIKDLEEQLAQERAMAKDREEQNRKLAERLAALERETENLRKKEATTHVALPSPSPALQPSSAVQGTATSTGISPWWLSGFFAMLLGTALLWLFQSRRARPALTEGLKDLDSVSSRFAKHPSAMAEIGAVPEGAPAKAIETTPRPALEVEFLNPVHPAEPSPAAVQLLATEKPVPKAVYSNFAREAAAYMAYGDYERAQACIEKAIAQDPQSDEHRVMLLAIYSSTGQHDKAGALSDMLLSKGNRLSEEVRKRIKDIQAAATGGQRLGMR